MEGSYIAVRVNWNLLYPESQENSYLRFRFAKYSKDDTRELRKLLSRYSSLRNKKNSNASNATILFNSNSQMQFVVLKHRYGTKLQNHEFFLKEYMSQKEKNTITKKPTVWGTENYEQHMTPLHHKIIISPDSKKVPLKTFTETLVKQMEKRLNYNFHWQAAIHTDTEHPHIHLLINGVDQNNKIVRFSKDFIKREIHGLTKKIATTMVGYRTKEQKEAYIKNHLIATRFTEFDSQIMENAHTIIDDRFSHAIYPSNLKIKKRLEYLAKIDLAKFNHNKGIYYLEKNWDKTLRHTGRYNAYITLRDELKWTKPYDLDLYTAKTGAITGEVLKIIRMNDEDIWNNAIVVENKNLKKTWFVPLFKSLEKTIDTKKYTVAKGDTVTISLNTFSNGQLEPTIKKIKSKDQEYKRATTTKKKNQERSW